MQGFNRYYPPDFDPNKHVTLNSYHNKHALGSRAHKITEGILVVRFELPFNIWCGTCNAHIGMGVRYNAEKRKIGAYYSTPIFAFRCKCHLCDGYFEIQTDPKNTRYVVTEGARQKDEEWDPEENGGFKVHDTDKEGVQVDPLAALEKTTENQTRMKTVDQPRIESLQALSEQLNADPYALSRKMRKRFREEKKVEQERTKVDEGIKEKYALPQELVLADERDEDFKQEVKREWEKGKQEVQQRDGNLKRRRIEGPVAVGIQRKIGTAPKARPSGSGSSIRAGSSAVQDLKARILQNTARSRTGKR